MSADPQTTGWRPIEAAPTDGNILIAGGWWEFPNEKFKRWRVTGVAWAAGSWITMDGSRSFPTHWTPLPEPPPGMSAGDKAQTQTTGNSVASEVMGYVIGSYGPLTEREEAIARAAARTAYRWTLREVIADLQDKVRAT